MNQLLLPKGHADLIPAFDYWREGLDSNPAGCGHKEWSHFSVLDEGLDVLINFSLAGSPRALARRPRVTVLLRDEEAGWLGGVVEFESGEADITPGRPGARIGDNSLIFKNGRYIIVIRLPDHSIEIDLELVPLARPVVANRVPLSQTQTIRWVVVPRLSATGQIRTPDGVRTIDNAPAYHDRNWGDFGWGGDYAWEWATVLPENMSSPWAFVYSRISDRGRNRTLSQSLIVWFGDYPKRKYYGRDLVVRKAGLLRRPSGLDLPRIMPLLFDGDCIDVPRQMSIAVSAVGDHCEIGMECGSFARIGLPDDEGLQLSALAEISASARVTGRIGGLEVNESCRVQLEFNCAGR